MLAPARTLTADSPAPAPPAAAVDRWGSPGLSPLALTRGKRFFRDPESGGWIPHLDSGRVAVALGEPLCEPSLRAASIRAFVRACGNRNRAAVIGPVSEDLAESVVDFRIGIRGAFTPGLKALPIGEEAIVDLAGFSLEGSARKTIRQSSNRLRRQGFSVSFEESPRHHAAKSLTDLRAVSDAWLRSKRVRENRTAVGWFDAEQLRNTWVGIVTCPGGNPVAFATLFTTGEGAAGIDLLRFDPSAPSGVMDLLLSRVCEAWRDAGYSSLSLGLAPLSGPLMTRRRAWPLRMLVRGWSWSGLYDCDGLRRFKEKFRPRWESRSVLYTSPWALPEAFLMIAGFGNDPVSRRKPC